jgi:hypothetical protein
MEYKTLLIEIGLLAFFLGLMLIPTFYRIKKLKEKEKLKD